MLPKTLALNLHACTAGELVQVWELPELCPVMQVSGWCKVQYTPRDLVLSGHYMPAYLRQWHHDARGANSMEEVQAVIAQELAQALGVAVTVTFVVQVPQIKQWQIFPVTATFETS